MLQQSGAEKVGEGRGRGKKVPQDMAANKEILQVKQQPGPSWQCTNVTESSNDETSDEEKDDGTNISVDDDFFFFFSI